jgi:hypothetical protein
MAVFRAQAARRVSAESNSFEDLREGERRMKKRLSPLTELDDGLLRP